MAAVGVPVKERTAKKAKELWPWLTQVARTSFWGLRKTEHITEISDCYFNVRLGRMTMKSLQNRVRRFEPAEVTETPQTVVLAHRGAA